MVLRGDLESLVKWVYLDSQVLKEIKECKETLALMDYLVQMEIQEIVEYLVQRVHQSRVILEIKVLKEPKVIKANLVQKVFVDLKGTVQFHWPLTSLQLLKE